MPSLSTPEAITKVMAINIAPSGFGKTGAIGSLANSGYNLRVLDYDAGCQILLDPKVIIPEARPHVIVHSLSDKYAIQTQHKDGKSLDAPVLVGTPIAFTNGMKLLNHWKTSTEDLGPITSWGTDTVLVVDTLTFLSKAAMNAHMAMDGKLNQHPSQRNWGIAMNMVETFLDYLKSSAIACHVLVNAHVTYINKPGEKREFRPVGQAEAEITDQIAYPFTLGSKLPPKVEGFFNLGLTMTGHGAKKHIEVMGTYDGVRTKNPMPSKLNHPFPIETGMADIFRQLTGKDPSNR